MPSAVQNTRTLESILSHFRNFLRFRFPCCMRKMCLQNLCWCISSEVSFSHYLLFRLQEDPQVENLMENMIDSMLHEHANEDVINQYSMGLVFLYLLNHLESLSHNSSMDYKETVVQAVLGYINSDCKNANLTKIAADTHQSMTVLSRLIKQRPDIIFRNFCSTGGLRQLNIYYWRQIFSGRDCVRCWL